MLIVDVFHPDLTEAGRAPIRAELAAQQPAALADGADPPPVCNRQDLRISFRISAPRSGSYSTRVPVRSSPPRTPALTSARQVELPEASTRAAEPAASLGSARAAAADAAGGVGTMRVRVLRQSPLVLAVDGFATDAEIGEVLRPWASRSLPH